VAKELRKDNNKVISIQLLERIRECTHKLERYPKLGSHGQSEPNHKKEDTEDSAYLTIEWCRNAHTDKIEYDTH
jgi:hypothetical protein